MKKLLLVTLALGMLSACSSEEVSPKLVDPQSNESSSVPISTGIFQAGDLILEDSSDSYYFGGFTSVADNVLLITIAFGEGYNFSYGQQFTYVFEENSTFKLKNGIVLRVVKWDKSKNEIQLEQISKKTK